MLRFRIGICQNGIFVHLTNKPMDELKTTKVEASGGTAFKTGFMGAFGVWAFGLVLILIFYLLLCCCCSSPYIISLFSYAVTPTPTVNVSK
jgi:hypothetical protein